MAALRWIGRILVMSSGVALLLAGVLALGIAHRPEVALVQELRGAVMDGAQLLVSVEALDLRGDFPLRVDLALSGALARFGLPPLGLVLLVAALLPGRARDPKVEQTERDGVAPVDRRLLKKAHREAAAMAKRGMVVEAAELCFASGLLDAAADYFIEAEEFERAAEIRHDQNRFVEAAELNLKSGRFEAAGSIFGQQKEFARSAEAYLLAGNQSVAAEMFEKADDHRRAADCYAEAGFPRHAAQAYVRCNVWEKAAVCLEEAILEEATGGGGAGPGKQGEIQKLVRMAGNLYERAGLLDKAEAVLVKGGCFNAAAEICLASGREARAAELFLEGKDAPRAADILHRLGDHEASARVLAEYYRDRGEDEKAAGYFEEAGELLAAGDLYRMLEQHAKAGECYERQGDAAQAAEMFRMAGDRTRAAENYERAGCYSEAAECFALSGDARREAEFLGLAGEHLRAGEIYHKNGLDDEAITVLQKVAPESPDFASASVLLGGIFRERGMLSLAVKKLAHAVGEEEITRDNLKAFYDLATLYEGNGDVREASELYEKILTFDYHYADVEARLARTREVLEEQNSAQEAAEGSGGPLSGSAALGRYQIDGELGRGGMGIVYKASDTVLDRTVAFKVLPATLKENPQAFKNFLREAKSAAQLNHPNIVTVYDAGEQDGVYYIAMEYVDGNTLKEIVKRRGKISAGGIVHVLTQVSEGLAYAHEKRIVHRDIKTANIMWTRERKAKIMDFGLAKAIEEVRNHTTVVSGTPYYMSPEQTLGKNVDHRTDIYSLGVTIFEMATATLPFVEGNLPYHHVHTPPPDAGELNPELPEVLCRIISRCLQKDPADRYQSTRELLSELRSSLSG